MLTTARFSPLVAVGLLAALLLALSACESSGPNMEPSAALSASTTTPRAGEPVTFTAKPDDPEDKIDALLWKFEAVNGDYLVDTTRGREAEHIFPKKGTYRAELTVRDNIGSTANASKKIDVRLRYSKAKIVKTEVRKLIDWPDDNPDLYYVLSGPSGELVQSPPERNFSPPNVPVRFGRIALTFPDLSSNYTLSLWADDGSGNDQKIKELDFSLEKNTACNINAATCYPSAADSAYKVLTVPPDPADPDSADTRIWLHLNWMN